MTSFVNMLMNNLGEVNIKSTIGWKYINGYWYYYKSDNTRAIGWIKPDNNWYYLKDDGKMATGWLYYNGTWYYCNASGAMLANTVVDGYLLGSSGAWIR